MTTFSCKNCGSYDLFTKNTGTQVGLYCSDCGKWLKWIGKEEQRLIELQILQTAANKDVKNKIDLSKVSIDDLLDEIRRRVK